jgi:NAD(P)-dependent dehydrogenase (short-subunit alcohol dehydrogenase family)
MIMGESLQGQVAIVTGASGALGTSVVISLLAAGATVAGIDRTGAKAEEEAQTIRSNWCGRCLSWERIPPCRSEPDRR